MEPEQECEDNDLDILHHFPSAAPSTPNSNISSPTTGNDETTFHSQLYMQAAPENGDPLSGIIAGMECKLTNSRRGPGRPRKDLAQQKCIQKRKTFGDQNSCSERIGLPISAFSSSESSNTGYPDERILQNIDELSNNDNYPGKVCCLCNLDEKSALGQGDFLRWETDPDNWEKAIQYYNDLKTCRTDDSVKSTTADQVPFRRQKSHFKGKNSQFDYFNELDRVGHPEIVSIRTFLDGSYIYLHRMCIMWSQGVSGKASELKSSIELIIAKSLTQKCSFCGQYGASVTCKMSCTKAFHLPCAAASGGFQIMENFTVFCLDHVEQIKVICPGSNISCHNCSTMDDLAKMIMCATCGEHFHTNCVGLINTPETRAGWNCSNCSKCQICRDGDGSEGRFIKCEQCQRLYHTTCLRPMISSLPKYGWKCNRCRVCTDCGSRTPGGGASSRWHCHYTICDSCYQQRNKGFSCPICHKAYRASAHKEMVKCNLCHRFVHSTCDDDADLMNYHKKKESNPDYDYNCPQCKLLPPGEKNTVSQNNPSRSVEAIAISQGIDDNFIREMDMENFQKDCGSEFSGIESQSSKIFRKKILLRGRGGGKLLSQKNSIFTHLGRKRNTVRGKGRQLLLNNISLTSNVDRMLSGSRSSEDSLSMERKILLCSAKDKFLLSQDICVMCGSAGINKESKLIACAQCGQCYHPFCVNTKMSNIILERGWRCLDCTVCESCGQRNDEARLILCDECDLSYHIYCISPPLETVPHGNWKCKWCAACQKCGRYSPGVNQQIRSAVNNGLIECKQCSSQEKCSFCSQRYKEGELIIQCKNCERWLHCRCDSINNEEEAQVCDNVDYHCILCRPKEKSLAQFLSSKTSVTTKINTISIDKCNLQNNEIEATFWVDGVSMSERGANMIKALSTDIKKKRKMRTPNDSQTKESGILAAIESVVAGSNAHLPMEEGAEAEALKKKDLDQYKDGMVWLGGDNSPPEGFSISTNDEGVAILRKKRQRNLQKIGIGGFSVRNRAFKKDDSAQTSNNCTFSESEKKKKAVRKKVKSRLSEAYPVYLQEAFFGKSLLEIKSKNEFPMDDSYISDDLVDLNDALFHDELPTSLPKTPASLPANKRNVENTLNAFLNDSLDVITKCNKDLDMAASIVNDIKSSSLNTIKIKEISNSDILTPSSCKETNMANIQAIGKVRSATFVTDIPSESCVSTTPAPTCKGQLLTAHDDFGMKSIFSESKHGAEFRTVLAKQLEDVNLLTNNLNDNKASVPFIPQQSEPKQTKEASPQIQVVPMHVQIQNSTRVMDSPIPENAAAPHGQFVNQLPKSQFKPTAPQLDSAGTQKTAEKMRRDEDLGEMATISAVLYANTQHPELKQMYPNWNDRCKQILKRWRSLSNEKKAPFLQQAKDNRSALRMRRSQQDQERICFNQKSLKEQEQERIWKQHQAKAKEAQNSLTFSQRGPSFDLNGSSEVNSIDKSTIVCNEDVLQKVAQQQFLPKEKHDNQPENKHLRTLLLKEHQIRTTTSDPWISNSVPINSPNNLYQHSLSGDFLSNSNKLNPFASMESKNGLNEESKITQPLDVVQIEQISGNENRQIFRSRKDVKATDSGDSELEKLDSDENGAFGDIFGGLGDGNDDDLLKSLTAEDDFNILEYADPALDELTSNPNLLNKLDFE
ncbi:PREDICTED: histone-lysine N-methyltransferase 2C isoform X1 [Rhagoletis zephyria]|uniref:histone-lysine N-methyltransferase 2C isoform X1 n=1 Tax=Rhagoletis zephyria TaxID=28612 RepID=UPI0008113CC7|nr:PREDICTED: histone-lysine N-methyltransferase 2C isoform X1 [Rhagoletis zephyria]